MQPPYGTVLFCDDIRDETSGKKIFIGVYSSDIIVADPFPVVLPTFAIVVNYFEHKSLDDVPVTLKVFLPNADENEPVVEVDLPIIPAKESQRTNSSDLEFSGISAAFKISPLLLEKEGRILVRAYRNNETIKLGSIAVRHQPQERVDALVA